MSPRAAAPEVKAAQAEATAAQEAVHETEEALACGRAVSAARLHKVRDDARHAVLALRGKQARAEREAAEARMAALAALRAEHANLAEFAEARMEAQLQALADAAAAVTAE